MVAVLNPIAKRQSDGREVTVFDVDRGSACGCVCIECGDGLVARQGEVKVWHFAHSSGGGDACNESIMHKVAKQSLASAVGRVLNVPDAIGGHQWVIDKVRLEQWHDKANRRPDAAVLVSIREGRKTGEEIASEVMAVEICVSNPKGDDYVKDMAAAGTASLEIDVNAGLIQHWIEKLDNSYLADRRKKLGMTAWHQSVAKCVMGPWSKNRRWLVRSSNTRSVCVYCGDEYRYKDELGCYNCPPPELACNRCGRRRGIEYDMCYPCYAGQN